MSAIKSVTVEVTEKHIKRGVTCDPEGCPIACALKAKGYRNVNVGSADLSFSTKNGKYYEATLNQKLQRKIERYDDTGKMKPFTLNVKVSPVDSGDSLTIPISI